MDWQGENNKDKQTAIPIIKNGLKRVISTFWGEGPIQWKDKTRTTTKTNKQQFQLNSEEMNAQIEV